jgi:hypothetical protein
MRFRIGVSTLVFICLISACGGRSSAPGRSKNGIRLHQIAHTKIAGSGDDLKNNVMSYHDGGVVLPNVELTLIFWGRFWNMPPPAGSKPVTKDAIVGSARSMLTSGYIGGLTEYKNTIGSGVFKNAVMYADSEPTSHSDLCSMQVQISTVVRMLMDQGRLPKPTLDQPLQNHLYLVVLSPGDLVGSSGAHWFEGIPNPITQPDCGTGPQDPPFLHIGFIKNETGLDLDFVNQTVAHELVEGVSNAELDAIWGKSDNCGAETGSHQCEVADACGGRSGTLNDGTVVEQYWSQKTKACIAPK